MMQNDSIESDHFSSLNDDCIYEIIKRLPLDDLCAISETCVRFNDLASDQFLRQYPGLLTSSELNIFEENGEIKFEPLENYERCFSQFVETVTIKNIDTNKHPNLAQFIRLKCRNIKKLTFIRCLYHKTFGKEIQSALESVETVYFNCNYAGIAYENRVVNRSARDVQHDNKSICLHSILKYCPKLRHLQLIPSYGVKFSRKHYPALETVEFCSIDSWNSQNVWDGMAAFLQSNPNVKRIICRLAASFGSGFQNFLRWFTDIISDVQHIEELFFESRGIFFFRIENWTSKKEFFSLWAKLMKLSKRNNFKRLEMKFGFTEEFRHFTACTRVQSFSDLASDNIQAVIAAAFHNINILQYDRGVIERRNATKLAKELSSLEEVHFNSCGIDFKFEHNIVPLVRFATKLVKIVVLADDTVQRRKNLQLPNLTEERSKLDGATKVVIYLDVKWIADAIILPEVGVDDLVSIKAVKATATNKMCEYNPLFVSSYEDIWKRPIFFLIYSSVRNI